MITDGTRFRSLHWTGHYIPDPTLGFASCESILLNSIVLFGAERSPVRIDRPWQMGQYQALGLAKSWKGKARIPSTSVMWKEYPGAGRDFACYPIGVECASKRTQCFPRVLGS